MKEPFNTRMRSDLRQRFEEERVARGRLKVEEALEQAVALWVASNSVPVSEQTLPCPHCGSALSGSAGISHLIAVLESVSKTEQPQLLGVKSYSISPEAKVWLDLANRAITVEDPQWRRMLKNIETQLRQVAEIADPQEGIDLDSPEAGSGGAGNRGARPAGTGDQGTAHRGRRKKA